MAMQTGASRRLAAFAAGLAWEQVPAEVRHAAKRCLVNFFATAIAGSGEPALDKACGVLGAFSGPSSSTVIGRDERPDMLWASFLNAASANVFDFDDTHIPTIIHPTAPVAPVVFALAENRPLRGEELLLAFILGVEIECRIGNAVSPSHYSRGWHITSTCGTFGAAFAAGKILGFGEGQFLDALGNASAQASGLVETLGTMSKSISVGNAARNGLLSALLAADGFSGPALPLEGPRGFLEVTAEKPDLAILLDGLGTRWEILSNTFKPYPCGVVLNPVIDACLTLRGKPGFDAAAIEKITLTGHPLLRQRTDRPGVATGRLSQVSAQHAVAISLLTGKAGLPEFSDESVADPAVRALGEKLSFVDDPAFDVEGARVEITLACGNLAVTVEKARGSLGNPLSDAELEDKLKVLSRYRGRSFDIDRLLSAIWALDRTDDAGAVMKHAAGH
ncbi:MmgE/PrpD family protein [Metarhizobium album]|nr:MmgE/PrpD family protein [Rhizobium album]